MHTVDARLFEAALHFTDSAGRLHERGVLMRRQKDKGGVELYGLGSVAAFYGWDPNGEISKPAGMLVMMRGSEFVYADDRECADFHEKGVISPALPTIEDYVAHVCNHVDWRISGALQDKPFTPDEPLHHCQPTPGQESEIEAVASILGGADYLVHPSYDRRHVVTFRGRNAMMLIGRVEAQAKAA